MLIPARILRAAADRISPPPPLSHRQEQRRTRTLDIAEELFATYGRQAITFSRLSLALMISTPALRFLFPDLDYLLASVLRRHLANIGHALATLQATPDLAQRARAIYHQATRTPAGGYTNAHKLLIHARHFLPEDERDPIEHTYQSLLEVLTDSLPPQAEAILECEKLGAAAMEAALTGTPRPAAPPSTPQPSHPGHQAAPQSRAALLGGTTAQPWPPNQPPSPQSPASPAHDRKAAPHPAPPAAAPPKPAVPQP